MGFRSLVLVASLLALSETGGAQGVPGRPPVADSTGESDVYPVGEAVHVYRAVLDLIYVDGKERPGVIVLWDTAQSLAGGPCSWKCREPWPHQSKIDTATILAYTQQSWKRPRIIDFGYKIPITLVSETVYERIRHDGFGYLADRSPDRVGPGTAFWEGFRRRFPNAWGSITLGKVAFNPQRTEALIGVMMGCGEDCHSQETIFLGRFGKQWRVIERVAEYSAPYRITGNFRYRGPAVMAGQPSQIVAGEDGQRRADSDDAAAIYPAILERLYSFHGESPRQIVLTTTRPYGLSGLPAHQSRIDSSTITAYKASVELRDRITTRFRYRVPVSWMDEAAMAKLARSAAPAGNADLHAIESDGKIFWDTFVSKYPRAWGYTSLGRIGFNPTHTQALVLTRHSCGPMCFNADTWFLERKGEIWYVVERMPGEGQQVWPVHGLRNLGHDVDPTWYRRRRVSGVLTDAETGRPLPGLKIEIHHELDTSFVTTDGAGQYSLENPAVGGYAFRVACPSGSPPQSLMLRPFAVRPGLDSTMNVAIDYRECPAPEPPRLAPNAPEDRSVAAMHKCMWLAMDLAMQPYIAQARRSWPLARKRFLAGLPAGQLFFVTVLLVDDSDRREQVFIAVDGIRDGRISGRIWNRIEAVEGYRHGDRYAFPESELRDWTIAKPDGTEEGNVVGKFLDTYEPPGSCSTGTLGG